MTAVVPLLCLLAGWSARLESPRWRDRERATAALPRAVALLLASSPRAEVAWRAREALDRPGRPAAKRKADAFLAAEALSRTLLPRGWKEHPCCDIVHHTPGLEKWRQALNRHWRAAAWTWGGGPTWPRWRETTRLWVRARLLAGETAETIAADLDEMARAEYDLAKAKRQRCLVLALDDTPPPLPAGGRP